MVANDFPAENIAPAIGGCVILFIALLFTVLQVVVFCKIYSRAGYSWAMGFLMLIPVVNFIMMLVLAFSEWPIQRQLRQFQQTAGQTGTQNENFRNL
jgi:hypothetical protein